MNPEDHRFNLRDIDYIDEFDECGTEEMIQREFADKQITGDIHLYKNLNMDANSLYHLRTISKKDAEEILGEER